MDSENCPIVSEELKSNTQDGEFENMSIKQETDSNLVIEENNVEMQIKLETEKILDENPFENIQLEIKQELEVVENESNMEYDHVKNIEENKTSNNLNDKSVVLDVKQEVSDGMESCDYGNFDGISLDSRDASVLGNVEACLREDLDMIKNEDDYGAVQQMKEYDIKQESDITVTETHLISNKLINTTSTITNPQDGLIESQTTKTLVMEVLPITHTVNAALSKMGNPEEILPTSYDNELLGYKDTFQLNSITGNCLSLEQEAFGLLKTKRKVNIIGKRYECLKCPKIYNSSASLRRHKLVHECIERRELGLKKGRENRKKAREKKLKEAKLVSIKGHKTVKPKTRKDNSEKPKENKDRLNKPKTSKVKSIKSKESKDELNLSKDSKVKSNKSKENKDELNSSKDSKVKLNKSKESKDELNSSKDSKVKTIKTKESKDELKSFKDSKVKSIKSKESKDELNSSKDNKHSSLATNREKRKRARERLRELSEGFKVNKLKIKIRKSDIKDCKDIKSEVKKEGYECTCGKSFKRRTLMETCLRSHNLFEDDWNYSCVTCAKQFRHSAELKLHRKRAHSKKRFACKFCPTDYTTRKELFRHLQIHQKVQLMEYKVISEVVRGKQKLKCFMCSKTCSELSELKSHVMDDHKEPYICPHCKETFPKIIAFGNHTKTSHPEVEGQSVLDVLEAFSKLVRAWKCEECELQFHEADKLALHKIEKHSPDVKAKFQCPDCKRMFASQPGLKSHQRIHHRSQEEERTEMVEKGIMCLECRKMCDDMDALTSHMRLHSSERKYPCKYCEFRFATPEKRKAHAEIHTGDMRYVCFICEYQCSSENRLKHHKNSIKHLNMKEYLLTGKTLFEEQSTSRESPEASKGSSSKKRKKSESDSEVENEVTCEICGEKFPDESTMLEHKQTHPFIEFPNDDKHTRIFFK